MNSFVSKVGTIGEYCKVGDGAHASVRRIDSGVPYLMSRNLKNGNLDLTKISYISEADFQKHFKDSGKAVSKVRENDVVFGIIGSLGGAYLVRKLDRFGISSSVAILRPDVSFLFPHYLFCWVQGHIFQDALFGIKGGVAQGYVSLEMIRSLPLAIPPLQAQKRISEILTAYDALIENNTRRIEILEEMARRLYEEWFVQFRFPGHEGVEFKGSELGLIPEGWELVALEKAVEINPKTKVERGGEKVFVPMGALSETGMVISGWEIKSGNSGAKFQNGDTLVARISPCLENGKTGFVDFLPASQPTACGSTEFIVLRSRSLCPEMVYCLSRSDRFREVAMKSMSGATGRQRVRVESLMGYLIAQPESELVAKYHAFAQPCFKEIRMLANKNANLRQQRDLLLPKLISGEIDVSDIPMPT